MIYYNNYKNKQLVSILLGITITLLANYFLVSQNPVIIILAVLITTEISLGTPIRQSIQSIFSMMIAIIIAACVNQLKQPVYLEGVFFIIYTISATFFIFKQSLNWHKQSLIFTLIFLFSIIIWLSNEIYFDLYTSLVAILLGGLIGTITHFLVFPARLYIKFSQGVVPLLQDLIAYEEALSDYFLTLKNKNALMKVKFKIEKSLVLQQSLYPSWVYDAGFNPGLRAGFRYFLIQLERITELFFAMDYYLMRGLDATLLEKIKQELVVTLQNNNELMRILIAKLNGNKEVMMTADYVGDIKILTEKIAQLVPSHLELLDISPDYISLSAFIQNIKDVRQTLLQLAAALPGT